MKMSAKLFNDLKSDIELMGNNWGYGAPKDMKDMWSLFNAVLFERMNDDNHPAFVRGHPRILSFWSHDGKAKTRDEQETNKHWLNRFYVDENLNDDHIATALRKIKKELWGLNSPLIFHIIKHQNIISNHILSTEKFGLTNHFV